MIQINAMKRDLCSNYYRFPNNDEANMTALKAPARAPKIQFSHFGINVRDMDLMEDFYTKVVGFTVTDRGSVESLGVSLVFMSMDPMEHHQFVICDADIGDLGSNSKGAFFAGPINQLSFRLESLDDLRIMHNRLAERTGPEKLLVGTHGIAWSVYAHDPEDNTLEFFVDTPWFIDQPVLVPFDLSKSDDEIVAETEAMCREEPGFQPYGEWRDELAKELKRPLVAKPF
jgi:catechol 2,3-dioxygenase-like lactoylglutathione lyase family enzyme